MAPRPSNPERSLVRTACMRSHDCPAHRYRLLPGLWAAALAGAVILAGCGSSKPAQVTPPSGSSTSVTAPPSTAGGSTTVCTPPQNNGGDHDYDNNGGPSDGDGCDR